MVATRIASINIKTLQSYTRSDMLFGFMRHHDIDVTLFQEVSDPIILENRGYDIHHNIGPNRRGTAIAATPTCRLHNIERAPDGRVIAATLHTTRIINIYAPSGTSKRAEREKYYGHDLARFLDTSNKALILGGDFNCVLSPSDTTGARCLSRELGDIVHSFKLSDSWDQNPVAPVYTHFSPAGATRIDRIYLTTSLIPLKVMCAIYPAAFTDHEAVVLSINLPRHETGRRT
jgi:endonuclease/exonuclease/phosphatase family metal-dependent hydrolase